MGWFDSLPEYENDKTGPKDVKDQDTLDSYVENLIRAEEARENN